MSLKTFKYAVELNETIDFFGASFQLDDIKDFFGNKDFFSNKEGRWFLEKFCTSIAYMNEKYQGDVRESHLYYIPDFLNIFGHSDLIHVAKSDTNGITVVFCDDFRFVPEKYVNEIIKLKEDFENAEATEL